MRFGQIRDAIGGTARILGLVSFRQHLLPSRATGRTRHASRLARRLWKAAAGHGGRDPQAAGHRGAAAHQPLRRMPLRPPPAGRLFRPRRRPEARRARQPPAALHPGPRDRRHGRGGGPEAKGVEPGKFYAAYPWIGCGKCGLCARGDEHLCNAPRVLGVTVDGGYATHVVVPHPRYLLDVEGIPHEIACALMCSGLTGYGAIKKALPHLRAGPLMIVGLGGVGMMALQFARALTDMPILVADIDKAKREAALKLGAAEAFDPADPGAIKAIRKSSRRRRRGGRFRRLRQVVRVRARAGGQGWCGDRGRPVRRQLLDAGADAAAARDHAHGQLRRLHRRGARDAGSGQGRQGCADTRREATARARPAARSTTCARARSSAAW